MFMDTWSYDDELIAIGEEKKALKAGINLLDILDDDTIARKIELPLEKVQELRLQYLL